jgi:hypothetical protein
LSQTGNYSEYDLNYSVIRQLFYKSYISGSILNSGSAYNDSPQSLASSGSFDNDNRYFPTI